MPLPTRIVSKRDIDPDELLIRVLHHVAEHSDDGGEFALAEQIVDRCRKMVNFRYQRWLLGRCRNKADRQRMECLFMSGVVNSRS